VKLPALGLQELRLLLNLPLVAHLRLPLLSLLPNPLLLLLLLLHLRINPRTCSRFVHNVFFQS
jgi:hypothetical protein